MFLADIFLRGANRAAIELVKCIGPRPLAGVSAILFVSFCKTHTVCAPILLMNFEGEWRLFW